MTTACQTHTDVSVHTPYQAAGPRALLGRLAASWSRRAQVRKPELDASLLDTDKDDFIPDLLPFRDHPLFESASPELRKAVLSCGWLAYNEKTVDIEAKIINVACQHIIEHDVPGLEDGASRELASETLIDEAYHILLVCRANEITRQQRGLAHVTIPECTLVHKMRACQDIHRERWQRILIQLATAIVSEVFISNYLKQLSDEMSIQPFNRLTVATHRRDELAHSHIFGNLAKCLYAALGAKERAFFSQVLPLPVRWFANLELDVWHTMLEHIRFPGTAQLIRECREVSEDNLATLDYSDLVSLADELGMLQSQQAVDSFGKEGLLT